MVRSMAKVISEAVSKIQAIVSGSTVSANHEGPHRLAARINDNHVPDGNLKPKTFVPTLQAATEPTPISNPEPTQTRQRSHCRGRKRKNRNFTMVSPQNPPPRPPHATEPTRQPYTGTFPKCPTCTYHHPTHVSCRICTTCNKYGHLSPYCRNDPLNQNLQPQVKPGRACYKCNDPNHLSNQCPQRNKQDSPQQAPCSSTTVATAAQTQNDDDVIISLI